MGWDKRAGGACADRALFGLLLDLLYEGYEGEEVCVAGMSEDLLRGLGTGESLGRDGEKR